jgi:hypothetical protein
MRRFEKKFRLQNGLTASIASLKDGVLYDLAQPQLFSIVTVRFGKDVIQLVYYTPMNSEALIANLSNKLDKYAHNALFMVHNGRTLGRRDTQWKPLLKAVKTGLPPPICTLA